MCRAHSSQSVKCRVRFLQASKKHSSIATLLSFAMGGVSSSDRSGQFFYDLGTNSYQWDWSGSLWTWQPFYVPDDIEDDLFRDYGGAWVSETGQVWRGVDPYAWARAYAARVRRRRRRQDIVKYKLVRPGLQQVIPDALVEIVLTVGIGGSAADRSTDGAVAADVAAEALKPFQELVNNMVL